MAVRDFLYNKNIIVVYPYSHSEISTPKMGATRLIYEQIELLKSTGHTVNLLSLEEVGSLMSLFLKMESQTRQKGAKRKTTSFSENKRWQLNLLAVIIIELLSRVDVLFTKKLEDKLKNFKYPASIIYHYPRGFVAFSGVAKKFGATAVLCEHNIEWKFFESNITSNKFATIAATAILKRIELNALQHSDHVICASRNDFNILKEAIDHNKMRIWIPINQSYRNKCQPNIAQALEQTLRDNFVVGFVGTNFGPNIVSVRNIIDVAEKMLDNNIVFIVIGNVSEAFHNDKIPSNIIFTGYVDDLDSYLSMCDAFLNLKTTTHTGIEIKMFDYLKFGKPIIVTKMGSSGFENNRNLIVVNDIADTPRVLSRLVETKAEESSKS
jgi:glycosyltransferase involved in cell wall biosynthesis